MEMKILCLVVAISSLQHSSALEFFTPQNLSLFHHGALSISNFLYKSDAPIQGIDYESDWIKTIIIEGPSIENTTMSTRNIPYTISNVTLNGTNIIRTSLNSISINKIHLNASMTVSNTHLIGAGLSEIQVDGEHIQHTVVESSTLNGMYLNGSSNVNNVTITGASLNELYFKGDFMWSVRINATTANNVQLHGGYFSEFDISCTRIDGVYINGTEKIKNVNITGREFLDNVIINGSSAQVGDIRINSIGVVQNTTSFSIGCFSNYGKNGSSENNLPTSCLTDLCHKNCRSHNWAEGKCYDNACCCSQSHGAASTIKNVRTLGLLTILLVVLDLRRFS